MIATATGAPAAFETLRIPWLQPEKHRHYTPDFFLPNGIVVESKGLFTQEDRAKMVRVKEQHPDLDIRMVFQNANSRISKGSPTTYAIWADRHGIPWAHKTIPASWFTEPVNKRALKAAQAFAHSK